MHVGLHMTVIEHCARVARGQLIGTRETRHHWNFAGNRYAVVALTRYVDETVIGSMQMQCVRHIVAILERYPNLIALFDADHGRWQAQ